MGKMSGVKKGFFVLLVLLLWAAAASAGEKPILILQGPDIVQVGTSVTYSVSTQGGADSSYTWWLGYTSNNAATIENGVLTALNPGVAGIHVVGNDTGAYAELHVQVVTDVNGTVTITGPDKVAVGKTATFSASTGSASDGRYSWFIIYSSSPYIASLTDTGVLTGISEGTIIMSVVDLATGLSGEKTVLIVTSEEQPALVSISAGVGEGFTVQLVLSIRGDIPADASLYIAVKIDDATLFLPSGSVSASPFRANPQQTSYETVLSVPVSSIPFKQYTFYAALLNSKLELVSNLDTAVISAGYK